MRIFDDTENSWSFTELAEVTVAYRACFDTYGPDDELTKSIDTVMQLAIEKDKIPIHYICSDVMEDFTGALGEHANNPLIDPWQCAQAAFMLKLVLAPTDSLQ